MTYNEAIKAARLKASMTQKEAAEALSISNAALCRFESGVGSEPSISRLIQLADLYCVSVDELIGHRRK